jgi:5-methylcytosine-specific restriction endonuclease McrA
LSEQQHDSPYSDAAANKPAPQRKPHSTSRERSHQASNGRHAATARQPHHARARHDATAHPATTSRNGRPGRPALATKPSNGRKRRRRGGNGVYRQPDELTSHPTTRNAYVETREWLLEQHGPTCAYCGLTFAPKVMTLDHVAPRRGQTAYDRRDNLVLACQACNAAKRDLAPLAFLLGSRKRAVHLVRYGAHLSPGLIEMARSLVPIDATNSSGAAMIDHDKWGEPLERTGDSPYKD